MKKLVSWILVALVLTTLAAPLTAYAAVTRVPLCLECGAPMYISTWEEYGSWENGETTYYPGTYEGRPAQFARIQKVRRVYTMRGYICDGSPRHHEEGEQISAGWETSYEDVFVGWL